MRQPVILPPITIGQGQMFYQEYLFEDEDGPIDMSDWTGEFTLSVKPFDDPFYRKAIMLNGDGLVRVMIEAASTQEFPALPRLGGGPSATFQIALEAPLEEFNQVWQGTATIAGRFQ